MNNEAALYLLKKKYKEPSRLIKALKITWEEFMWDIYPYYSEEIIDMLEEE